MENCTITINDVMLKEMIFFARGFKRAPQLTVSSAVTNHFNAQRLDGVLCCLWLQVKPEGAVQRRHLQRVQLPEEHQGFQTSAGLLDGLHQLHSCAHLHWCVQVANVSGTKRQVSLVIFVFVLCLSF